MTRNVLVIVGTNEYYYMEDLSTDLARELAACHNKQLPETLLNKIKNKKLNLDCPKPILGSLLIVCNK